MKKLFTIITLLFAFVSASMATILYPKAPKADLLDIRFNVDGTATDVSGKKHKIVSSQPRPSVAVNDRYNLNAATFTGTGKDFYFFDYSADKKFIEEISGDFTMECLMRIDNFSKANTPFCSTNASGFGFDIGWFSRNNLSFLIHDGSKYVAVIDKSMAEGKYYHAVGVVRPNKTISFYVNGELIGTTPFTTLRLPSGKSQKLYVGCDVNGNGDPEYAFKGEVVVARMYSKALTNEEVKSVYKAISSGNNSSSNNSSGNTSTSTSSSNLIPEGVYVLKCAGNKDYVMTLKDGKATNRNQIVISKWQNTNAQKWKVTHEKNGTIVIRSMVNNKYAINVSEHQMNDHGQIISWLYENAQNEQWVPEKQSNGNFVLKVLENQNFALDIEGATYSDNVKVQLYGLHRGTNQQWIFQKAGTTSTGGNSGNDSSTTSVPNAPNHMLSYRGQNGKVYTFKVTGSTNGRIWGGDNNIYTDDSIIATAAVHAGLVKAGQTGTIKVKILPGQSSYSSIKRNGVTSYKNNGYGGSYQLSK